MSFVTSELNTIYPTFFDYEYVTYAIRLTGVDTLCSLVYLQTRETF